jgi:hypothetical protein
MAAPAKRQESSFSVFDPAAGAPAFRSPRVAALFSYWCSLCAGRAMPARSDVDPSAIRNLLPHLMLVDMVGDPPRARYRLVGTAIVEMAKLDFTGQFADEIDFQEAEDFDYGAAYLLVATTRQPGCGISAMLVGGLQSRWIEFVICPLSDDGVTVDRCIALEDYEPLDLLERDSLAPAIRR